MAKNRHSVNGCPSTTPFDREVKKRYFPTFSIPKITNLRGVFQDNETANSLFSNLFVSEVSSVISQMTDEEKQSLKDTYGEDLEMAKIMEGIDAKLTAKEKLSSFEQTFMETYAVAINKFLNEEISKDLIKEEMEKSGVQTASTSSMYTLFKSKIPVEFRNEVTSQLCSIVIQLLDMAEKRPEYEHFTRSEIIDMFKIKGSNLRGFNALMYQTRRALAYKYNKLKKTSEGTSENNGGYTMTEDVDKLFQTLLNDDDAWAACVYQTKSVLLEAEKIKIGNKVEYVEEVDEDDVDNANSENDVQSAEEEGPEHWQLKADTISSFNSMAREVRSLLYKLTTDKIGVLGFPSIVDTMLIHQNLMSIRGENFCQNSSEFLEILKATNTPWAQQLYNILLNDSWKRTSVFNAYRKNHLNYVFHRKSHIFDKVTKSRVPIFYRNRSGRNSRVLLGAYRAGVLDIDPKNKSCIFESNGLINLPNKNVLIKVLDSVVDGVSLWNEAEEIYDTKLFGATSASEFTEDQLIERKRDFILTINDALNLHLYDSDVDILMNSEKEFKNFCISVHEIADDLKAVGRNQSINSMLEKSRIKKHFQRLVRAAKHAITIQERESPIEGSFRYNKSTYMTHTVPNSLGDNLERLGKAASQGIESFRQYLENTYLNCPAFATKTDGGYIIYNYWLKLMYESSEADLKSPTSFVNRFINELTRGLGTDEAAFETFAEKDNYIFTLNEFLQNKQDSNGKFGATPLFITGDSNSTRFLTTPILSSEEVISRMVSNVLQEVERMKMFGSMLDFFDNPDNVDSNSEEYSKRRQLKVSEGHEGKTVSEWMHEKEERRPSIIRNKDKFTFFPFLNDYKDELFKLLEEAEENGDVSKAAFTARVRELLNEHLGKKYTAFLDELKSKNIVSEVGRNNNTLNPAELSILGNNGEVIDTAGDLSLLWNFYLNTKFNLIQQLQFLTVDPGFYINTEDLQKRFKENIASGDLLDLEALDPSNPTQKIDNNNGKQKVRYIDEILTDLDASDEDGGSQEDRDFMQALREAGFDESVVGNPSKGKKGKYNKNTLTDGQGYRSFTSYRKLMIMRGEPFWTKAHEEVYQIIKRNREAGRDRLSKEDLQRILDLGVVFQPLKPFYYGFEELIRDDGSKIIIPVQHKYSEYPIIPELLPAGSKLGELGKAMEEDGTDLVCCTTCVKVGGFGSTKVKHCKTKDDFKEAFKSSYEHQLSLEGWRQQSNIPEHVDSSRARGTQFTKHGYGSIAETSGNKHYSFLGRIFKRGEIKLTKNKTISIKDGLNMQNLIQLFSAIGSAPFMHASIKANNKISNPREASDILSELRANDSRGAKDNIAAYNIDDDGEILMSPSEGMMAVDNMASLLSKLRKEVIKQPIKGGSAVQVSAYGFEDVLKVHSERTPDGKFNIVYADCAIPFAFSFSYEDGTTVDLSTRYLEFVDPETGMLLDEDSNPVEPEEATGEPGKEFYGWNTKLGKLFPGCLDMIAYRIPTEKDYSILNLKAKRFFPKTAGGTIMVPSQFTTIAGFDFDIDKLYFIRREYVYGRMPNIDNYDIWTDLYKDDNFKVGKQIKPYLDRALNDALHNVEGSLYLGKDAYMYWGTALDMMAKEGIDISKFPKTAEEAFQTFVNANIGSYAKLKSYYDDNRTVLENSQAAVNNLFFDYMQARLEDYDTFSERYIPGGFQMLEDAKPVMMAIRYGKPEELIALATAADPEKALMELSKKYEGFSPDYDATELSTIAHYQTYNALYDNCISISAVQNINQRLTALLNKLVLKDAVKFGSLLDADTNPALSQQEKSKVGKDIKARFVNGVDTELLTTNYLASSVDAVKNALLEFFGISDKNLNIGCLLSKIGCTAVDIGLLLNQPVAVRAMEIMKEGKGFKSLSNSLDEAMQELTGSKYRDVKDNFYYDLSNEGKRDSWVATKNLIKYIGMNASVDYIGDEDTFIKGQFAVVHLMKELQADAQELAEEVAVSQSTSIKSVKSTFGAVQAVLQKAGAFALKFGGPDSKFEVELPSNLKYIINPAIRFNESNMDEVLEECLESPYCMEQIAFSAIMGYAEALGDYFPYTSEGFNITAEGLAALTSRGYLSAEMFDIHNKAAMMFFLERMTDMFNESNQVTVVNSKGEEHNTKIPNRVFYTGRFPEYFKLIIDLNEKQFNEGKINVRYKDIPILGSISAEMEKFDKGAKEHNLILKMESIGGLKSTQKDTLIDSWESMFYSDDPVLRDLAKHLFMYSYYNRGFDFGPTTFMSLVPLAVKMQLGEEEYAKFFNRVFNVTTSPNGLLEVAGEATDGIVPKEYYKSFILNTRNMFYQFTKKLFAPKGIDLNAPYSIAKNNMREDKQAFTVTIEDENDKPLFETLASSITKDKEGNIVSVSFVPCVEIDGAVYICDSNINADNNSQFNVIASGTMTYYRMDVPVGVDYSAPTLYGTRETMLENIGQGDLINIVKNIIESAASQ